MIATVAPRIAHCVTWQRSPVVAAAEHKEQLGDLSLITEQCDDAADAEENEEVPEESLEEESSASACVCRARWRWRRKSPGPRMRVEGSRAR
mmetsp:Transcript_144877/g.464370  ORF Transcript_144877/g.464370 Transcript_144877/m.464370 type:complete len:92 (-) Transcript_144877:509-784(-)